MNITFMIGNGFDRNMGLRTTYSDFIKYYKQISTDDSEIEEFKNHIREHEELWSDAEIEFGAYTGELERGTGARLSKCHTDFCLQLANYLKKEERRIDYSANEAQILAAVNNLNSIYSSFPTNERQVIETVYSKHRDENYHFYFLCFNYTSTLDNCLKSVQKVNQAFGSHRSGPTNYIHSARRVHHVHGTVDENMVFGVNDDSQIKNTAVFDCEDGDLFRSSIIKVEANASYQENADLIGEKMLNESQIVYIYGMSIGDTDKLWWDRVCRWLLEDKTRHVIVHNYSMPRKGPVPIEYQRAERQFRKLITSKSSLDEKQRNAIEDQIHVTGSNFFSAIEKIAELTDEEKTLLYMEQLNEAIEQSKVEQAVDQLTKAYERVALQHV